MKTLAVIGAVLAAYQIGYIVAHMTVATECRRLGAFYVGKSIFKCIEIKDKKAP
jgi:hypothetical protein